jgi:secondary thiamine-phosphate synthase enzyme
MTWIHKTLSLRPYSRGCHLITRCIVDAIPELSRIRVGLLHVFIQHTSASLTINENADPDVRTDFEMTLNHLVPEDLDYVHTLEGPDDMPAHVKASLMGAELTIPVKDGRLCLGTWQGIYLCEHRDSGSSRQLVLTLMGESVSQSMGDP